MAEIIVIGIFAIIYIHERGKKKKHPGYRSWIDDDRYRWDQWRK